MSSLAEGGSAILYMKVGTHAQEDLASIIARKQREIEEVGVAMWGYGGSTCHPTSMVQPFAQAAADQGRSVVLAMQPMSSKHSAEPIRAEEFSRDGITWEPVPDAIHVLGSRYALCLKTLEEVEETLNLAETKVALGNSKGKAGDRYIRGRVDKACLEVSRDSLEEKIVPIRLVAELVDPYAVFLRG
jgi:hypothetical protein